MNKKFLFNSMSIHSSLVLVSYYYLKTRFSCSRHITFIIVIWNRRRCDPLILIFFGIFLIHENENEPSGEKKTIVGIINTYLLKQKTKPSQHQHLVFVICTIYRK